MLKKKRLFFFFVLIFTLLHDVSVVVAEDSIQADVRYLYVQPGQTLHNIVRRLYPERKKDWKALRKEIIKLNPQAFPKNKEHRMLAGVKLTLPGTDKTNQPKSRVGEVITARGQALAVGRDKVSRSLSIGDNVYVGDRLVTGEDGFIRLLMIDQAKLDIRCFSILVIEDYYLKGNIRRSVLNLLQGSLRKVTGEIGDWKNDLYELRTPVASVGVRGTEYAVRVFQSKGCDGTVNTEDDGMFLSVIKGLVDVHNQAGSEVVVKGDTLYVALPGVKPVKKVFDAAILEPVVIEPEPEPEEESNFWWWMLGLVLIGVAI